MNTDFFIGALGLLSLAPIAATAQPGFGKPKPDVPQKEKKNVIMIVCDDLNCDMGSWEDPIVKTPNLDRLRQHAVRFNNAYCQYPLSGPTRASFMTGYSPERTGVNDLFTHFRKNIPNAVTLPELFKNNGYFTARVGKVYHAGVPFDIGQDGLDDPQSWNEKWNPIGKDKTSEEKIKIITPQLVAGKRIGAALSYWATDGTDDELTDGIGANILCKMIRDHRNEPFFLAMGFYRPHVPFIAPKKYFDMYPWQEMTLPEVPAGDVENKPACALTSQKINYGLPADELKKAKAAYYASITFFDAQIGKILDQLETSQEADNTIIVFVGDNGYNMGQHGQWQKQLLFEHSARVPLMISVPGMTNGKDSYDKPVEQLDIYPTIANLCNMPNIPSDLDGRSLIPILKDVKTPWKENAYTQQLRNPNKNNGLKEPVMGHSVRTERYRYTEWNEGNEGGELYDYQTDPNEYVNLYNNKKYKKIQAALRADLHQHYAELKAKKK